MNYEKLRKEEDSIYPFSDREMSSLSANELDGKRKYGIKSCNMGRIRQSNKINTIETIIRILEILN